MAFINDVEVFDIQHVRGQGKFAFGFVEGPLIHALRNGDWCVSFNYFHAMEFLLIATLGFSLTKLI